MAGTRATHVQRKVAEEVSENNVTTSEVVDTENPLPTRIPMDGGHRDRLTVTNKDPGFEHRWVTDTDSDGARIYRFKQAGYEMAPNKGRIGERNAKTPNPGGDASNVRVPANKHGEYHYLMRIKKEWYDEDQANKMAEVNKVDAHIHASRHVKDEELYNTPENKREHILA